MTPPKAPRDIIFDCDKTPLSKCMEMNAALKARCDRAEEYVKACASYAETRLIVNERAALREELTAAKAEIERLKKEVRLNTGALNMENKVERAKVAELEEQRNAMASEIQWFQTKLESCGGSLNFAEEFERLKQERDELKTKGEQLCVLSGNQMLLITDCEKVIGMLLMRELTEPDHDWQGCEEPSCTIARETLTRLRERK